MLYIYIYTYTHTQFSCPRYEYTNYGSLSTKKGGLSDVMYSSSMVSSSIKRGYFYTFLRVE